MSKSSSRRKRQALKKKQEARLTGPVLTEQGLQAFKQGDYQQAIQAWEKARQKGNTPAGLTEAMAEAYFRRALSNPQSNLTDLAQAVQLQPVEPVYQYHLALAYHRLGQLDPAEAIYRQLLAVSPPYERAAIPLSQLLIEKKKVLSKDTVWGHLDPAAQAYLAAAEALLRSKADSTLQRLAETPLDPMWRGLVALALGDEASAQQSFQAAVSAPPQLHPLPQGVAHYYLGALAAETGQLEVAYSHWQTALACGLDTPHLRHNLSTLAYRQAVAAQQAGRPAEAFTWLEQVAWKGVSADLADLSRQVNFDLGYAAAQQGQWDQALAYWQAAEKAGDESRQLLLNLALAYQKTERHFEAAECWRELLRRRPRKASHPEAMNDEQVARIWQNVADNYNMAGDYDEAVSTYKNALKWSPDNIALRLKLVEALQAAGRWQAAENELNRILAQHPKHVPALVMLAEMYAEDFFPERARQLWLQVLELEPQHPVARQQLAYLYEKEGHLVAQWGNPKRALEIYQEGLRELPDSQRLCTTIGRTYAQQKNFDQARHYFDRAVGLNPDDLSTLHDIFVVWLNHASETDLNHTLDRIKAVKSPIHGSFFTHLIEHCLESNQEAYAKTLLDTTEARYLEDEATLLELAMLRADLNQEEHAAALLRRILKKNPDHAQANLRLGTVYYKIGQTRLAHRHWDKAAQQARKEGDHDLLYELKMIKDILVYGKPPPRSPLEMLRNMPPQLRQQMLNQLPPEVAAILENADFDMLEAILGMGIPGDFDEDDDDEYF